MEGTRPVDWDPAIYDSVAACSFLPFIGISFDHHHPCTFPLLEDELRKQEECPSLSSILTVTCEVSGPLPLSPHLLP